MSNKLLVAVVLAACGLVAQAADTFREYAGKAIYVPIELLDNDFKSNDSKWSYRRMLCSENVAVFWAKDFGDNPAEAPDLEGHNMKVDMNNLLARLEKFYHYFYEDLGFLKKGSNADDYRMMVMLDYSLEGTAYGGDYDGKIGALWIAPNRVQDEKLNCIAHELGHSFQSQITCDGEGDAWGGCGFFEMASQWMLWQVNPDWQTDENYHLKAFRDLTHKAFLHIDNIYHSPYILEYWSEKRGLKFIAELFREGKIGEDPVMTYKRVTGIDQEAFNDEMFDAERRMINWDYPRVWKNSREYANQWHTKMVDAGGGWQRVDPSNCPENYGFNAIELPTVEPGKTLVVQFRGEAGQKGYVKKNVSKAGWRYGLVAVDKNGRSSCGEMKRDKRGELTFTVAEGEDAPEHLWLVVMGAPTEHWSNIDGDENPGDAQWCYSIKINKN
jgi:hypothetical protein